MNLNNSFTGYKHCAMCGRPIAVDSKTEYCKACTEESLFKEVREYIRTHDVTEYELAETFQIPKTKVRRWIHDGRIEYVESQHKLVNIRCMRCGAPISSGNYCASCMRVMDENRGTFHAAGNTADAGKIRFVK
jgi:RNA polymerase subunit RPABC4/transcription elongation factor Spt4